MRRILVLIALACLFQTGVYAADTAKSPAAMSPSVTQVIGKKADARLGPALYPQFTDFVNSTDARCQAYLEKDYADGGLSLAPICTKSTYGNGRAGGKCQSDFLPIEELNIKDLSIPEGYRSSAKLLITWTVRIEGYSKQYSVNPELCRNWYGTLTEKFPSGPVKTALYVNGQKVGSEVSLEIPSTESIKVREVQPSSGFDPTLVGSYVVTAEDFPDKKFPANISLIEIRWKNETSMDIVSPKGMRNIILNMLPVTKQN